MNSEWAEAREPNRSRRRRRRRRTTRKNFTIYNLNV
jgi:hypothetical protein